MVSTRHRSAPATEVVVQWSELSVELLGRKGRKGSQPRPLLEGCSGSAPRGQTLAIIGPSGAGKTTLLQTLAGRLERVEALRLTGSIEPPPDPESNGFIYQNDSFFSRLTVKETLRFAAALSVGDGNSIEARATAALERMGLQEVGNSVVGGGRARGISGGERKRLSIGCELVCCGAGAMLFADEPTSGLDSFQALRVVDTLRECAHNGGTSLLSVHQPGGQLLSRFDRVCLLGSGGRTLYLGPPFEMAPTLENALGISASLRPPLVSGCEWALQLASVDPTDETATMHQLSTLAAHWSTQRLPSAVGGIAAVAASRCVASWPLQLRWCLWRSWRQATASKALVLHRIFGTAATALLFGFVFWKLPRNASTVKARTGLLQVVVNYGGMTSMMKSLRVLQEGEATVVWRERAGGHLRLSAYFIAKLCAELPLSLALSAILALGTHALAQLASPALLYARITALEMLAGSALGMCVGALSPSLELAMEIGKAVMMTFTIFGGLYFDESTLPAALSWLPRVSLVRIAWDGAMQAEYQALAAPPVEGRKVLEAQGLGVAANAEGGASLKLALITGCFYLCAFACLVAKAPKFQMVEERRHRDKKE